MHYKRRIRQIVLILLVGAIPSVLAADADPVRDLQQALRIPSDDAATAAIREERVTQAVARLRTVQDLRRALTLTGWRDDQGLGGAQFDQKARDEIVQRLVTELRTALTRPDSQLAATDIIGELGTTVRETGGTPDHNRAVMRRMSIDLARLTETGSTDVKLAAARALSKIDAPPDVVAAALGRLLHSDDVIIRRGGAEAIKNAIVQGQTLLAGSGSGPRTAPVTTSAAVLRLCAILVPVAADGATDADITVRKNCAEAIRSAAQVLYGYLFAPLPGPRPDDRDSGRAAARDVDVDPTATAALARALSDQFAAISRFLTDSDPEIRLLARRVLEDMADARRRITGQPGGQPVPPRREPVPFPSDRDLRPTAFEASQDPALQQPPVDTSEAVRRGLTTVLATLAEGVNDSDVEVRRATLSVLELMGTDALPATSAIIQAVGDRDRFVRWIAGRTLGRLQPADPRAVYALAGLLQDPDLDVRQVGALALERYGVGAEAAVPALGQAVQSGDPDARIAALRTLRTVGPRAAGAIPSIIVALQSSNARVRQNAAVTIGRLGPDGRSAEAALRQALRDPDSGVRGAAGEALLSVLQAPAGR